MDQRTAMSSMHSSPLGRYLDPQQHLDRLLWAAERALAAAPLDARATLGRVVELGRELATRVDRHAVRLYVELHRASVSWPRSPAFNLARRLLQELGNFLYAPERLGTTSFLARAVAM